MQGVEPLPTRGVTGASARGPVQGTYLSGGTPMSLPTITPSREVITAQIIKLKTEHDRMPAHWVDRRLKIMDTIDDLVDDWLAANN